MHTDSERSRAGKNLEIPRTGFPERDFTACHAYSGFSGVFFLLTSRALLEEKDFQTAGNSFLLL